jgi:hypothetical protein
MHYDCRAYMVWTLPPLLWRCNLCRKLGRLEQLTLLSVSGIGLFSKSTGFNSPIWIGKTRLSVGSESLPWQSSGWPFSLWTLRSTQLSWWTEYPSSRSRCRQSFFWKFDLFHDIGTQRGGRSWQSHATDFTTHPHSSMLRRVSPRHLVHICRTANLSPQQPETPGKKKKKQPETMRCRSLPCPAPAEASSTSESSSARLKTRKNRRKGVEWICFDGCGVATCFSLAYYEQGN